MGCASAKIKKERYNVDDEQCSKLVAMMRKFNLSRSTLDKLYKVFSAIDNDGSSTVHTGEFCAFFDIEHTKFVSRVFSVMDEDSNGTLDFFEFVAATYNYCTYDWKSLVQYAFELFDHDGSGMLEVAEVEQLVAYVYGKKIDGKVKQVLSGIDKNKSGTVSFTEFAEYNRNFPILLFPAFQVQESVRRKVLGTSYWERQTKRNQELDTDARPVLEQLLEMQRQFEANGRLLTDADETDPYQHKMEPASPKPVRKPANEPGKLNPDPLPSSEAHTEGADNDGAGRAHGHKHKRKKGGQHHKPRPKESRALRLSKEYSSSSSRVAPA